MLRFTFMHPVAPAQAGAQPIHPYFLSSMESVVGVGWIPAYAGMTAWKVSL